MTEMTVEQEIQAKADKGPRVTPEALKNEIVSEWYFTGSDGAYGASLRGVPAEQQPPVPIGHPLTLMTFCVLVLRNGFTVHGVSACASPENFNADIGRRVARENAEREIWPLLGFLLREELSRPMPPENGLISELAAT